MSTSTTKARITSLFVCRFCTGVLSGPERPKKCPACGKPLPSEEDFREVESGFGINKSLFHQFDDLVVRLNPNAKDAVARGRAEDTARSTLSTFVQEFSVLSYAHMARHMQSVEYAVEHALLTAAFRETPHELIATLAHIGSMAERIEKICAMLGALPKGGVRLETPRSTTEPIADSEGDGTAEGVVGDTPVS